MEEAGWRRGLGAELGVLLHVGYAELSVVRTRRAVRTHNKLSSRCVSAGKAWVCPGVAGICQPRYVP